MRNAVEGEQLAKLGYFPVPEAVVRVLPASTTVQTGYTLS
jgi:hypothetical protein